mmetsp:Transcript_5758/g.9543  ORF Transcript_5758/g.9543 Transcript_5758/m.9543 type:complete len:99 (-) Transcript_5758:902-1198(-)
MEISRVKHCIIVNDGAERYIHYTRTYQFAIDTIHLKRRIIVLDINLEQDSSLPGSYRAYNNEKNALLHDLVDEVVATYSEAIFSLTSRRGRRRRRRTL